MEQRAVKTRIPKVKGQSMDRTAELQRFCWQYREKLARRTPKDLREAALIEAAAIEAAQGDKLIAQCLTAHICDRVLLDHMRLPMGRRQFYAAQRRFYTLLDEMR